MSAKSIVSKSEAVRDYLEAHPAAPTKEIVAALDKRGIKITLNHAVEDSYRSENDMSPRSKR